MGALPDIHFEGLHKSNPNPSSRGFQEKFSHGGKPIFICVILCMSVCVCAIVCVCELQIYWTISISHKYVLKENFKIGQNLHIT